MLANRPPENPFFMDIIALEDEIAERKADIKQLYNDAKETEGVDVKLLRRAVKLHMEGDEKRRKRKRFEETAEDLLRRLGVLASTPLGEAAMRDAAK
jgi:uncharacterized protein (UPF0335 family)